MKTLTAAFAVVMLMSCSSAAHGVLQDESKTKEEFITYAKEKLRDGDEAFFEKFFAAVDKNADGIVSADEFSGRMQALQAIRQDSQADETQKDDSRASDYEKNSRRAAPKDAFPVFDNPKMLEVSEARINVREPVIGVVCDGEARAYPISIMGRHELGNDVCGKTHITVSW